MNTKKERRAKSNELRANNKKLKAKSKVLCFMPFALSFVLFALCFLLFAVQGYAEKNELGERIVIFPFENFSEDKDALTHVMPLIKEEIKKKKLILVDEDEVDKFLLKERIRSTAYISRETAKKLSNELKVNVVLLGSINTFSNVGTPHIGLSARLVRCSDNSIIWADHEAATGEDFITVLGMGRIESMEKLARKVINKLFDSFNLTPRYKEIESSYKIAVMPFYNKTKIRDIGMVITYMFITELFKNERFIPLEFGDVRQLIVDLRIKEKGEISLKNTKSISDLSGVDGIIVGTIDTYREGLSETSPPEVSISARLLDARTNKILWSDFDTYKGDDDIIVLDWRRIRSVENVAYKVVTRLIEKMSEVKW